MTLASLTASILMSILAAGWPAKVESVGIARYKDGKEAAVSLTYDDGVSDHYTMVAPHLEANGLRGTFWVIGSFISDDSALNWKQLKEMSDNGHEISNHSWSHVRLTELSDEEARNEIRKADDAIEEHIGKRPKTFAYPFNAVDSRILALASEGRVLTRLHQKGQGQGKASGKGNNYSTLPEMKAWLQKVIADKEWGVTMTHGIVNGWDPWEDPQVYWDFLEYCGGMKDKVWFDTFEKVASYVVERDSCTLDYKVKGRKLTVTPACSLDSSLYTEPLTLEVLVDGKSCFVDFDPFGGEFKVDLKRLAKGKGK